MMSIISKIPMMDIRATVTLWQNAIRILSEPAKSKHHADARHVIRAIYKDWVRRRKGSIDPDEVFNWPSTDASSGIGGIETRDWEKIGVLKFMGYSVGQTDGMQQRVREIILSEIFDGSIPPVFPDEYLDEWSDPSTASRLKKMAETIAALTRNARRRRDQKMSAAIRDWEKDLEYLYWKYYVDKFNFAWPDSRA